MSALTRRRFLTGISGLAGGLVLGSRPMFAKGAPRDVPGVGLDAVLAADALRELAAAALDAATANGARYADVRVAYRQQYVINTDDYDRAGVPGLEASFEGGVRALAGGAFGCHFDNMPTVAAMQTAGHAAATMAKGMAALEGGATELAPAPSIRDSWVTPYEIDPFTVPLTEQTELCVAFVRALGERVPGASTGTGIIWSRETRVCMTTTGTVTTQTFLRPGISPSGNLQGGLTEVFSPGVFGLWGSRYGGYEMIVGAGHQDRIQELVEATLPLTMYPTRTLDVGRYPIVFDGSAAASLLTQIYGPAFQGDRVLGFEANASGTSFISPLEATLVRQREAPLVSPLCTLTASRPTEWISGARWDDDGVEPQPTTLVRDGLVVGCMSDRQTAPALAKTFGASGVAVSGGYACGETADRPPMVGNAHFTLSPNTKTTSRDDLMHGISHGVLIIGTPGVASDQQLASGLLTGQMMEIRNGKLVSYLGGVGMQFRSVPLLKSMKAIGDASTMGNAMARLRKGQPTQSVWNTASAPAFMCPAGDFVNLDVTLS